MGALKQEQEMEPNIRYSPCEICDVRGTCESNCIRFNVFVSQDSVRLRRKNFLRFADKMEIKK